MVTIPEESIAWWKQAKPGQWFIGVYKTDGSELGIVPVNVFDRRNNQLQTGFLANTDPRGVNRYASGADGESKGETIMPNWLTMRPDGVTHHVAVAQHFGYQPTDVWGFAIIKINDQFAQVKTSSNSLNTRPDAQVNHSFSRATAQGRKEQDELNSAHENTWIWKYFYSPEQAGKVGMTGGSMQMSAGATASLETDLKSGALGIEHIAMSMD